MMNLTKNSLKKATKIGATVTMIVVFAACANEPTKLQDKNEPPQSALVPEPQTEAPPPTSTQAAPTKRFAQHKRKHHRKNGLLAKNSRLTHKISKHKKLHPTAIAHNVKKSEKVAALSTATVTDTHTNILPPPPPPPSAMPAPIDLQSSLSIAPISPTQNGLGIWMWTLIGLGLFSASFAGYRYRAPVLARFKSRRTRRLQFNS